MSTHKISELPLTPALRTVLEEAAKRGEEAVGAHTGLNLSAGVLLAVGLTSIIIDLRAEVEELKRRPPEVHYVSHTGGPP